MSASAKLTFNDKTYELPVVVGTENEHGVDISSLRSTTGLITLDDSYANTGSCQSEITFIDGEKGILRYRGYPIEQLAEHSLFAEASWLLIFGELPGAEQLKQFRAELAKSAYIHEDLLNHFDGYPPNAHPMGILSGMINALGAYEPAITEDHSDAAFERSVAMLMSKVRTIAAASYKKSIGEPIAYPRPDLNYAANFLHMMFSKPNQPYEPDPAIARALDVLLLLHADHEQNCSTSTVRMVGSSQANLHASLAAGVCALWGPLHGGANQAVIAMLERILAGGETAQQFLERVKKDRDVKLMGFGHRVYKNFDPRAQIIKHQCDNVLAKLGVDDPLLDLAKEMEQMALNDEFFKERKLYPNVDFYSGIIMRAIGIPLNMFTVIFAIGRMPGWVAHWKEVRDHPHGRIYRPRQIYSGAAQRDYVPADKR